MNSIRPSLSERLADQIVDLISAQNLASGDVLESSRRLAERFAVTTPTVREALRRLEATDVISLRHGSGIYIGAGFGRSVLANPHRPKISHKSVLELIETRLVLEPGIAAEAARRHDAGALDRLQAATANALVPPVEGVRPGLNFHVELAAATGNALLWETMEALLHQKASQQTAIRFHYDDRDRDHAEHLAILAAVREGDCQSAETLTREHLAAIRDLIARKGA